MVTRFRSCFRLIAVKFMTFCLICCFLLSIQQRLCVAQLASIHTENIHSHENEAASFSEIFEFFLTGQFEHSHSHEQHSDEESHSHTHQHSVVSSFSFTDIILNHFCVQFPILKQVWPRDISWPLLDPFQSEILRPPIQRA